MSKVRSRLGHAPCALICAYQIVGDVSAWRGLLKGFPTGSETRECHLCTAQAKWHTSIVVLLQVIERGEGGIGTA